MTCLVEQVASVLGAECNAIAGSFLVFVSTWPPRPCLFFKGKRERDHYALLPESME